MPEGYDNKIESNTNSWFEGTMYFPTQHLMFHSNTTATSDAEWSLIVADTLEVSSGTSVTLNADMGGKSPLRMDPVLVE